MFKVFEEYLEDLQKQYEEAGQYRYCCECSDDGLGQQLKDAMDTEARLGNRIRFAKAVLTELKEYVINKKEEA